MKTNLLLKIFCSLLTICINSINAQEFRSLSIQSGFNADVIANGVGSAMISTTNDMDGLNYVLVSRDFKSTSSSPELEYGLPNNGKIISQVASTPEVYYQLAPYDGNNSMRLAGANTTGTLSFSTISGASTIYLLATSGSGNSTAEINVNFSDSTKQTFNNITISEWYSGSNYAIKGLGRVYRTNNTLEPNIENPRLYQIPLILDNGNISKSITSITVKKTDSNNGVINVFAVSAKIYTICPAPTNIVATSVNLTEFILNWTAPTIIFSPSYEYYLSSSSDYPSETTNPTGSIPAGTNSKTLTNLIIGQDYYFWIRSNCGSSKGFWKMKYFRAGQINKTYSGGDINTLYAETQLSINSTNSCPGTISIDVPQGYKVQSAIVAYNMTSASAAFMSEQRSILFCTTSNKSESSIALGAGNSTGTFTYERTGLNIANGLKGTVNFELRGWRTWGGGGCSTLYSKIDSNSWTITLNLEKDESLSTSDIHKKSSLIYPNPTDGIFNITNSDDIKNITISDTSGRVLKKIENPKTKEINISNFKSGVYYINLQLSSGNKESLTIVKK